MWINVTPPQYPQQGNQNIPPQDSFEQHYKFIKKLRKAVKSEYETEGQEKKKKEEEAKKKSSSPPSVDRITWFIILSFASPLAMIYMFMYVIKDILTAIQHIPK